MLLHSAQCASTTLPDLPLRKLCLKTDLCPLTHFQEVTQLHSAACGHLDVCGLASLLLSEDLYLVVSPELLFQTINSCLAACIDLLMQGSQCSRSISWVHLQVG